MKQEIKKPIRVKPDKNSKNPIIHVYQHNQKLALELFRSEAFLAVNKNLLKQLGPIKTIFLENLMNRYEYEKDRGLLHEDGSFFLTHEDQCEQTGLSIYQIRECKKVMTDIDILKIKRKGVPSKEYYFLNMIKVLEKSIHEKR